MHECVHHVQAKDGFQFLCVDGRFSKIQSHIHTHTYIYSGVGLVLSIWFIIAAVLNSKNNFIIAKLTV